jgi:hypothetical protein
MSDIEKQGEKLDLEIKSLRKKNRWEPVAQLMPIIATLLGIAGFFFTVVQFQSQRSDEQQKDRISREVEQRSRFQNQIRTDIDEILRSAHDERQTVSSVAFLLEDMKTVLKSNVNESRKVSDVYPEYERSLTKSLVILVRDDYDFTKNPRDVDLANIIIYRWDDYSKYLEGESPKLNYILYEYTRALQSLRDQNPGYLEGLKLNEERTRYIPSPKYDRKRNGYVLYNHFISIVDGFKRHIEILGTENLSEEAREVKANNFRLFEAALCNRTISKYILGPDFTDQPCGDGR